MIIQTDIPHKDERGKIYTLWDKNIKNLIDIEFIEDKVSISNKGVIKGFHGDEVSWKLITCLNGICNLVVCCLDKHSSHYKRIEKFTLQQDGYSILVPPKYINAHECLTDNVVFFYKLSQPYNLQSQITINPYSQEFVKLWDIDKHIISKRDVEAPTLKDQTL